MRIFFLLICFISFSANAQLITNYNTVDGLLDDFVECVDVDLNNNVWFGTSIGAQFFDGSVWISYNSYNSDIIDDNIKVIKCTSDGSVWFGTDFGLSMFDGLNWFNYDFSNGLISNQVKSIDEAPDASVWVGTNLGVSHFDGSSWVSYSSPDLHWSGVNSTSFDGNGNTWFSSPLGGCFMYDGLNFINYGASIGLISQNLTDLIIDNQDNKWIGTGGGMSVLDASNTDVNNYTIMYTLPPPDTLNPVVDIEIDSQNNIWVAVYVGYLAVGGVAMWNGVSWSDYDVSDGIVGPNIKDLAIDSDNNIWVATSTGVSKIEFSATNIDDSVVYNENNKDIFSFKDILGRSSLVKKNTFLIRFNKDSSFDKTIVID